MNSAEAIRAVAAAVRTSAVGRRAVEASVPVKPFITISRQAGAGGKSLGNALVERLNRAPGGHPPWVCWDRELVERVAADHKLSSELIDCLTERGRSWVQRLTGQFAATLDGGNPDELIVYRRVASTVRGVAEAGHVVIVGRGGMRVTQDMPGGLHLRLVAPLNHRVAEISRRRGMSREDASAYVTAVDRGRAQFYERFLPGVTLEPEHFSITFNTAAISEAQIVAVVAALLEMDEPLAPLKYRSNVSACS